MKVHKVMPILEKIAWCESGNRQFDATGAVVRGKQNKHDIGRFQINDLIWGATAKNLGYDIYTLQGNTDMALYIYRTQGLNAWAWSFACWQ